MSKKISKNTFLIENVSILSYASVVSKKEGEGPLGKEFDVINEDSFFGKSTWEKAESEMQRQAVTTALEKANLQNEDIDIMFAGDLLNQCIASTYGLRELDIAIYGLYGACSTMGESLGLASLFVDGGLAKHCVAVTSSHFCSAERQYRFPLEYGGQRTPTAQWTVTGSGSVVVATGKEAPFVKGVTVGKIRDFGITDANNMGAAMAPAAAYIIKQYLTDTGTKPSDYDKIFTGDLGEVGSKLLVDLLKDEQIDISPNHNDCGKMIYYAKEQDVHAGGSGCGCSASVLCSYILSKIKIGEYKNVLFIPTGAMMSPTSVTQGESIPSVAHLVHIGYEQDK